MALPRGAGILLHITSLPGEYGCGDLGSGLENWLGFLESAGMKYWQILPVHPPDRWNSPYAAQSAFAGNLLFISPQLLHREGLLEELPPPLPGRRKVDFERARRVRRVVLQRARENLEERGPARLRKEFQDFRAENSWWLADYARFSVFSRRNSGKEWTQWPSEFRRADSPAWRQWERENSAALTQAAFDQWVFFRQWRRLRKLSRRHGVHLIGDLPLFVARHSADVWGRRELFLLNRLGNPVVVAGVPPDYFSPDGQLWGNPHYHWPQHRREDFAWWRQRISRELELVDILRLDHFRGLEAAWAVPARNRTARKGNWRPSPGRELLERLHVHLGKLPFLAEDLGHITPGVVRLRRDFGLPGMKVLQFAFHTDGRDPFLPHNYRESCVVYTGTHDNDTTRGWWRKLPPGVKQRVKDYLDCPASKVPRELVRLALSSTADLAVIPMQDLLEEGSERRMNYPGRRKGNWNYRITKNHLDPELARRLRNWNELYGRYGC